MRLKRLFVLLPAFVVLTISFQNCAGFKPATGEGDFSSEESEGGKTLSKAFFDAKCVSCHSSVVANGSFDASTYEGVLTRVVPGNVDASVLAQRLSDMPPGDPLSAKEREMVEDWILAGAPDFEAEPEEPEPTPTPTPTPGPGPMPTPTPVPTPTPMPTPTPTPTNATYTWVYNNIFKPRCVSCHGTNGSAGYNFTSYTNTMKRGIRAGDGASSAVYQSVEYEIMPSGSPKLTAAQKAALKAWIDAGALNN